MRGSRCKAIRKAFVQKYGRPPRKTTITKIEATTMSYMPSEWRQLKREWVRSRAVATRH